MVDSIYLAVESADVCEEARREALGLFSDGGNQDFLSPTSEWRTILSKTSKGIWPVRVWGVPHRLRKGRFESIISDQKLYKRIHWRWHKVTSSGGQSFEYFLYSSNKLHYYDKNKATFQKSHFESLRNKAYWNLFLRLFLLLYVSQPETIHEFARI